MKNLLFALIFSLVFGCFAGFSASAASFSDIPESSSYFAAVESLKSAGIINGYEDGTFKPNSNVNRVEALKMILLGAEISADETSKNSGFPDVPADSWFNPFVLRAKNLGIVNGNADGTFAPARTVNKAEFVKLVLEAFDVDVSKHRNISEDIAADVSRSDWFSPYLSYAKTVGIISPTLNNELEPSRALNRGQCAEIIYRMVILEKGGDAQKMLNIAESNLISVFVGLNTDEDIQKVVNNANNAVFYTERALEIVPDDVIAIGANKISQGFRSLCLAYQAALEGNKDSMEQYIDEAKSFANEAAQKSSYFNTLKQKINELSDSLN